MSARVAGMYNRHHEILDNKFNSGLGVFAFQGPNTLPGGGGEDVYNDDTWGRAGNFYLNRMTPSRF